MQLFVALAAIAAGTASPLAAPVSAAQCAAADGRALVFKRTLGRSELLTRIANAGLAQEREIAAVTARSRASDKEAASSALRLLADPAVRAEQARMDERVDQLFDRVVAALQSPDEVKRCHTVVETLAAVVALEAESQRRADALAARLEGNLRLADAR